MMRIYVANNLTIQNITPEFFHWIRKKYTLANPEYIKLKRMGFWTGNTPQNLCLYEVRGDEVILPFGVLRSIPETFTEQAQFISRFKPSEDVDFEAEVPLYDYQERAVNALIQAKYGILQSAAGSGKTQMGIALASRIGKRTLWLCHTRDLINQSKERALRYMPESLLGTITEGKVNLGKCITFATIQTMCRLDLAQYKDYWDCIITDEVHRVSGSPTAVTQYEKVLNSLSARHKYGLSATVHRSDGMIEATYALVGGIAYVVPDEDVADKIMRVGIYPVGTGVEISDRCCNTDGTLNYTKLITYLVENNERSKLIAYSITNHPSLILSDRLEHLETIMNLLPKDMRKDAVMISGKMTSKKAKAKREQALEDMRTGRKKYLFATYSLAKEGLDIPCLERLYLATPVKDFTVVTQSIGRIARTCDGKQNPICYDFVDNIRYLVKAYKKRLSIYKKNHCYLCEDEPL